MRKKLELDANLRELCTVSYELFDPEPIAETAESQTSGNPIVFTTAERGVLSKEEVSRQISRANGRSLAAAGLDVAITRIECANFQDSQVLPAAFQMTYRFRVANFSETAIPEVGVTLYFNPAGSGLVEQGVTTVRNIPARMYQWLEFTFPPVEAGSWVMTMEANKNRAFAETNYANNTASQTFQYQDRYELIAESLQEEGGRTTLPLNTDITFTFDILNVGSQTADSVPVDFPAIFTTENGKSAAGSMGSFVIQSLPAHKRSRGNFIVSFQQNARAQIGLRIDKDNTKNDLIRSNNEVYAQFQVGKVNPSTGDAYKVDIDFSESVVAGRTIMPLYDQSKEESWVGLKKELNSSDFMSSGCGLCCIAMVITYMGDAKTPAQLANAGVSSSSGKIESWENISDKYKFTLKSIDQDEDLFWEAMPKIYTEVAEKQVPVIYYYNKNNTTHFVVISGYEFDPRKADSSSSSYDPKYDPDKYGISHFRVMDPYKGTLQTLDQVRDCTEFKSSNTLRFVERK